MYSFVPLNLGFQHISRNTMPSMHQTVLGTKLLANELDQIVLTTDGTYLNCQKSPNNEFQWRTYNSHKNYHLVKSMIITASVSMIAGRGLNKLKRLVNTIINGCAIWN